jgi:hypothetical protein
MKNKLLITTAISTIALSSFAVAETKVTGQLDISYNVLSGSGTGLTSDQGFGRESQINISNSGDLNNGMKYAAGFSLEFDGAPTAGSNTNSISDENLYINFITGNTTFSIGQDHGLNTDTSAVPRVSIPANSFLTGSDNNRSSYAQGASIGNAAAPGHVKEGMGVFVAQKFDGGTAQIRYTPSFADDGGSNDAITGANNGSAFDVNFAGNLGVKGLNVNVQYAKAEKADSYTPTTNRDSKGKAISASYNFGQVTVGAGRIDREFGSSATAEATSNDFGITFAANDKLSFGLNYIETEVDNGNNEEEITMAQVGYNLGAVGIAIGYADVSNLRGQANTDIEQGFVRLSTKF